MSHRIVRLQIEGVKRVKAVDLEVAGDRVVVVRGNNAQGKSSVLDSIEYAFGGKGSIPPKVVREGEEEARIVADCGSFTVERLFDETGKTKLVVKTSEGVDIPSPQTWLNELTGKGLAFDPSQFMHLEDRAQLAMLQKIVGLDFTALEEERDALYAERTVENRRLADMKGQFNGLKDLVEEVQPVDVVQLAQALSTAQAEQTQAANAAKAVELAELRVKGAGQAIDRAKAALAAATAKLEEEKAAHVAALVEHEARLREAAATMAPTDEEVAELRAEIAAAKEVNLRAAKWAERQELVRKLRSQETISDELTKKIDAIDAQKERAIREAKFPVAGLGFTRTGVTFNGLPLKQASSAEQLRVTVGMAVALNPGLGVILLREGSFLDSTNMGRVAAIAEEYDVQLWIEVVGKDGEGFVIEDGAIEEDRRPKKKQAKK